MLSATYGPGEKLPGRSFLQRDCNGSHCASHAACVRRFLIDLHVSSPSVVPGREGTVERPSLGCGICPTSCGEPARQNPAVPLDAIIGTIWRLGSYRFRQNLVPRIPVRVRDQRGVRRVNAKGRDRAESISECLSHRRGDRTPSIEFAIRQDVDRVRPGFFWPVLPAGLGRRFVGQPPLP